MTSFNILDHEKIEEHITFIRIEPTDIELTLREIVDSLADISWLSQFDQDYHREAFRIRADNSIKYIKDNIIISGADSVTSDSGEYVVSELARKTLVEKLGYLDMPLAELLKIKDIGNHGFDFYTCNLHTVLLFGEAKYNANQTAYGIALKQIVEFIDRKQDSSDIIDIDLLCCNESKQNFADGHKGYVAAFASKDTATAQMIKNIQKNADFVTVSKYHELICIAVNI
ncbi:hypothetical protein [Arcticibacter tournemirensis]